MRILAALVIAAGALLSAGAAGALELGWGWAVPLLCLCAGVALHVVAPSSYTMYVGALVRFALRPRVCGRCAHWWY